MNEIVVKLSVPVIMLTVLTLLLLVALFKSINNEDMPETVLAGSLLVLLYVLYGGIFWW